MPNVEQIRKRREEEARKREEQLREERKRQEEKERMRHKQELERKRVMDMAVAKQKERKDKETLDAEMKSLALQAALGDRDAAEKLEEMKRSGQGARPYTGNS